MPILGYFTLPGLRAAQVGVTPSAPILSFIELNPDAFSPVFDVVMAEEDVLLGYQIAIFRDGSSILISSITQEVLDTGIIDLGLSGEPSGSHDYTAKVTSTGGLTSAFSNTETVVIG